MKLEQYNMDIARIKEYDTVYIYGAGDVAREVYFCLSQAPYNIKVEAFLVSTIDSYTPREIEEVPVISYDDEKVNKSGIVIVAVLEKYRDDICGLLDESGMQNRVLMTFESDLWSVTRSRSFIEYCKKNKYPYTFDIAQYIDSEAKYNDRSECCVYVNRSVKDRPLKTVFGTRKWEKEIYAGAALDTVSVDGLRDDAGLNISKKNRKYCELTSMYWIWKNTTSGYVGLSHYRRRFDFTDVEVSAILNGKIDVVLTTPVVNVPSVEYMYGKNHDLNDWKVTKEVVEQLFPEYSSTLTKVETSNYYVPYNMFIMKRSVFNAYCEWLFTVLEECEKRIGDKEDVYQNRYIGFLAERLMTVYFLKHKDELTIVFGNKHFLE